MEILTYQIKFPFVHLTDLPMTTIRVPKRQKPIIRFAKEHLKPSDKKKYGDCYHRWVKSTSQYQNRVNYGPCEESESTHFEIKINNRRILYRISDFFDGSEAFSSDYDHETETHIRRGTKKVSKIKYDKSKRDEERHGCVQEVYNAIIEEISDNDDEQTELMDTFKHSRVELRFHRPGVTTRENPLCLNTESNYERLFHAIEKEIKKLSIFILKPGVSTDDYLNIYKERLKKVNSVKPITPDEYGRIIGVNWNNLDNQINALKLFFIK